MFKKLLEKEAFFNTPIDYTLNIVLAKGKGLSYDANYNLLTKDWTYELATISDELKAEFPKYKEKIEEKIIKESHEKRKELEELFNNIADLLSLKKEDIPKMKIKEIEPSKYMPMTRYDIYFLFEKEDFKAWITFRLNDDFSLQSIGITSSREKYVSLTEKFIKTIPNLKELHQYLLEKNKLRLLFLRKGEAYV